MMALRRDEVNKTTQSQVVEPIMSGIQDDHSTDNETVAGLIHLQPAAGNFSGEQVRRQRVTNLPFLPRPALGGRQVLG